MRHRRHAHTYHLAPTQLCCAISLLLLLLLQLLFSVYPTHLIHSSSTVVLSSSKLFPFFHHKSRRHDHIQSPHTTAQPTNLHMDRYLLERQLGRRIPPKTVMLVRHGQSEHNAQVYHPNGPDYNDPRYLDAPLTPTGRAQASSLHAAVRRFNPHVIVSSPMTRAIETALLATRYGTNHTNNNVPFVVTPLCTERMACSCDVGSPVSELCRRFPFLDFSGVMYPERWWYHSAATRQQDDIIEEIDNDKNNRNRNERSDSTSTAAAGHHHNYNKKRAQLRTLRRISEDPCGDAVEPQHSVLKRCTDFRSWLLHRTEQRIIVFAHGVFLYNVLNGEGGGWANCETRKLVL